MSVTVCWAAKGGSGTTVDRRHPRPLLSHRVAARRSRRRAARRARARPSRPARASPTGWLRRPAAGARPPRRRRRPVDPADPVGGAGRDRPRSTRWGELLAWLDAQGSRRRRRRHAPTARCRSPARRAQPARHPRLLPRPAPGRRRADVGPTASCSSPSPAGALRPARRRAGRRRAGRRLRQSSIRPSPAPSTPGCSPPGCHDGSPVEAARRGVSADGTGPRPVDDDARRRALPGRRARPRRRDRRRPRPPAPRRAARERRHRRAAGPCRRRPPRRPRRARRPAARRASRRGARQRRAETSGSSATATLERRATSPPPISPSSSSASSRRSAGDSIDRRRSSTPASPDGSRVCAVVPPSPPTARASPSVASATAPLPLDAFGDAAGRRARRRARRPAVQRRRQRRHVVGQDVAAQRRRSALARHRASASSRSRTPPSCCPATVHLVRLEARPATADGPPPITLEQLVRTALRLRPDRLVVGEVRGPEVLALVQALNTGHDGSWSTCHANSALDVLHRLETLVVQAAPAWPLRGRPPAAHPLDRRRRARRPRTGDGRRRVVEIGEVVVSGEQLGLRPLLAGGRIVGELTRSRAMIVVLAALARRRRHRRARSRPPAAVPAGCRSPGRRAGAVRSSPAGPGSDAGGPTDVERGRVVRAGGEEHAGRAARSRRRSSRPTTSVADRRPFPDVVARARSRPVARRRPRRLDGAEPSTAAGIVGPVLRACAEVGGPPAPPLDRAAGCRCWPRAAERDERAAGSGPGPAVRQGADGGAVRRGRPAGCRRTGDPRGARRRSPAPLRRRRRRPQPPRSLVDGDDHRGVVMSAVAGDRVAARSPWRRCSSSALGGAPPAGGPAAPGRR